MNLEELRQSLEAKKAEIRNFIDEKKADEAEKAVEEKRNLEKLIAVQEELEADEKRELEGQRKDRKNMEKVSEFRSIVKKVMGEELTPEERAAVTSVDNAAVLPKEFVNQVIQIQKGFGALKGYCDVIPVTKNSGTIPVVNLDQNELADIAEGDDIVDGTLATTDVSYTCGKVGLLTTLTSELVDDAEVEIESLVKSNYSNIATVKENNKILKVLKDNAVAATYADKTDYEIIEMAIDTTVPGAKTNLVTVTNITGYAYLKNKKDLKGKSLDLITMVNGIEYFHGKPIVVADDTLLPVVTEGKNYIFYVANMKEAVKYIERKGISIARSTEAGFDNDTVKLRILERMAAVKGSVRSIKRIEF